MQIRTLAPVRIPLRVLAMLSSLAAATVLVGAVYPLLSQERRRRTRMLWCRWFLRAAGVQLVVQGVVPDGKTLVVANHVSWLDIVALNAVRPMTFVCKSDVGGWPLIGWLARRNETVFLRRRSASHARHTNIELVRRLRAGDEIVAAFPEGTTTEGDRVLPFGNAIHQAAIDSRTFVQPVAIRYTDSKAIRRAELAFAGTTSLLGSFLTVASCPDAVAHLHVLPPIATGNADRRWLAVEARHRIVQALHQSGTWPTAAQANAADHARGAAQAHRFQ